MLSQEDKGRVFQELHDRPGAFVIPNPWDVGSARFLAALGFPALATTSSGFAHSLGRLDGAVTLEEKLAHCRELCAAVDVPVSADLENGYADAPDGVAETIRRVAETGVVGASVEDFSGSGEHPIYDYSLAVERVQAAVEAAHTIGFPFTLTARAENLLHGRHDLEDTIRRLQAFEEAGADVLYAPGLKSMSEVRAVTAAVNRPVNVLAPPLTGVSVGELAAAGVARVSVGGALARCAIAALLEAGRETREHGTFNWAENVAPNAEIAELLGAAGG